MFKSDTVSVVFPIFVVFNYNAMEEINKKEEKDLLKEILDRLETIELGQARRRDTFTLQEAAKYVGLKAPALYKLCKDREITYSKPSKQIYFKKKDLDEYLNRNTVPSFSALEALASNHVISSM